MMNFVDTETESVEQGISKNRLFWLTLLNCHPIIQLYFKFDP